MARCSVMIAGLGGAVAACETGPAPERREQRVVDAAQRVHGLSVFAEVVSTSASVRELVARTADAALDLVDSDSVSVCRFERAHARIRILHNAGRLAGWEQQWPEDETSTSASTRR